MSDKGSQRSSGAWGSTWGSRGRRSKPGDSSLGDLKDPGETLDASQAALAVEAASDTGDKVQAAVNWAEKFEAKQTKTDAKDLEKESKEAQNEASS